MKELTSTPLVDGLVFGEGPRWHDGKLWFSDIWGERVMTVDERGRTETIVRVPTRPSGLGFLPDGRLLIASMEDRRLLRLDPAGLTPVADLTPFVNRGINDMVVDGQGRAYIGGSDEGVVPGRVMLVTPDGEARVVAEGLEAPNGAVITPDGKTYVLAETRGRRLTAFDILPDGGLANRRVWADFAQSRSVPDGVCLDAEGAIWIGSFSKSEFLRVRPGGEVTHRVHTPGKWSVACMLGGLDRRTLFLMTAVTTMQDLPQGKAKGFIETTRVEVPGAGWP